MKITAVSDLHGFLPPIEPCDLLLVAGDLTPCRQDNLFHAWRQGLPRMARAEVNVHDCRYQAWWLDREFRRWLEEVPAKEVVGVAGNHDWVFQQTPDLVPRGMRWTYLQDSGATVCGLRVWGSPWQPVFFNWAFNAEPERLRAAWAMIPDDTEVLVLHGPPYGWRDHAPRLNSLGYENVGCKFLRERVTDLSMRGQLKLAVWGHIHNARGVVVDAPGFAKLANVSIVDEAYRLAHAPMTWEID